eukprot:2482325-Rhodomonas_salina.1
MRTHARPRLSREYGARHAHWHSAAVRKLVSHTACSGSGLGHGRHWQRIDSWGGGRGRRGGAAPSLGACSHSHRRGGTHPEATGGRADAGGYRPGPGGHDAGLASRPAVARGARRGELAYRTVGFAELAAHRVRVQHVRRVAGRGVHAGPLAGRHPRGTGRQHVRAGLADGVRRTPTRGRL